MIKICLYGPESVGKTSLAKDLSGEYHTKYIPEVAREMVFSNSFSTADIIAIGEAQTKAVLDAEKGGERIIFCDTDLITTQIYSKIYLNAVPKILFDLEEKINYDQYFLFDIDVPWVADGLRDLGEKRKEVYDIFKTELEKRNISFINVLGNWDERKGIVKNTLLHKFGIPLPLKQTNI